MEIRIKYKEQIEKEAQEYAKTFYPNEEYNNYMGCLQSGFIEGVNSAISERIKIEYAIECLNSIYAEIDTQKSRQVVINKIREIKNKRDGK